MSRSFSDLTIPNNEYDRTILVSGIPEGVPGSSVFIHFQKRKNGGGDVKSVTMLTGGEALVVFEDPEVAKNALKTEQKLNGSVVMLVRRPERKAFKDNAEKSRNEEGVQGNEARTVLVSGLSEEATKNSVFIHFQKKKNGGGEVESVEMLGKGKAVILFENAEVAERVIATEQKIQGKIVLVERDKTKTPPSAETLEEPKISEQESARVVVSGLPEEATGNGVFIHFQKKKNGGGEIKKVDILPNKNKAIVTFESLEVAKNVVAREQVFKGKKLNVTLQSLERGSTENGRTVVVSGLPEKATENSVFIHFQKKKNCGGDVKEVVLFPDNTALVVFQRPEVAERIVTTQQKMNGKDLTINFLNIKETSPEVKSAPEATTPEIKTGETTTVRPTDSRETAKTPEAEPKPGERRQMENKATAGISLDAVVGISLDAADPVFSKVTATINPMLMNTGPQNFWNDVFNIAQKTCGVQWEVLLTGSLNEITKAREFLELQWKKHCKERQSGSSDHHNVFNPESTDFDHGDTSFNQNGKSIKQDDLNFNPGATNFNQGERNFDRDGAYLNPVGTSFIQGDTNYNQGGTGFDQYGSNFNRGGARFNQEDTSVYYHGTASNLTSTNMHQNSFYFNQIGARFPVPGQALNQHAPAFHPHSMANSMGSSFRQQEFVGRSHSVDAKPESQYYQQHIHNPYNSLQQGYQQSGRNGEERWLNERGSWPANSSSTSQFGPHFSHYDMRNVNQPPNAKERGFAETIGNHQPYGKSPNIAPEYRARSPYADENDHSSVEPSKSFVDNEDKTIISGAKPASFQDGVKPPQALRHYEDSMAGAGSLTPRVSGKTKEGSTTIPQSLVNNQYNNTTNAWTGPEGLTSSSNLFGSPSKDKTDSQSEKPLLFSQSTTNHLEPARHEHNVTPNSSTERQSSPAFSHFALPVNDKIDLQSEKPAVSPRDSTNQQPAVEKQQNTTSSHFTGPENLDAPTSQFGSSPGDRTDSRNETPPTSFKGTENDQTSVNHDESTTALGAKSLTNSSNLLGLRTSSEQAPGLPERTENLQQTDDDQQATTTEPTTGPQNINNSSDQTGMSLSNEKLNSTIAKLPDSPDRATKRPIQPLNNEQLEDSTTSITTIELQNSAKTGSQVGVPSTNTPDFSNEKPHSNDENALNNRSQHNQQQATPNQHASIPDVTNIAASDTSSASGEKLHSFTHSDNKPQRKTPVPLPRQSKLGTSERRQNAANFSSPVKTTQAKQDIPAPDLNDKPVNDKAIGATNPCEKNGENSTNEITAIAATNPCEKDGENSTNEVTAIAATNPYEKDDKNSTNEVKAIAATKPYDKDNENSTNEVTALAVTKPYEKDDKNSTTEARDSMLDDLD